jgi:uncharacterized protein (AIM24 family)
MPVPVLLSTSAINQTYSDLTYHIEGEVVPVLHVELGHAPIYFEHHVLLWKDPSVGIDIKPLKGAYKRMIAGMSVFVTQAHGPGNIGFSRDGAGHVFALHLTQGQAIDVREHQFLAATDSMDYAYTRVRGFKNIMVGGTGFFIDTFTCRQNEGIVWLHGYGNVFEVMLAEGQQIDIEPGGWIYKDANVRMETTTQKLATGFLASAGSLFWNRFTGPGRIGVQSMYLQLPTTE